MSNLPLLPYPSRFWGRNGAFRCSPGCASAAANILFVFCCRVSVIPHRRLLRHVPGLQEGVAEKRATPAYEALGAISMPSLGQ